MHHPRALSRYLSYFESRQVARELIKAVVEKGLEIIRLLCLVFPFPFFAVFIVSDLYKTVWCSWIHHMLNNRGLSAPQAVPVNQERCCNVHPTCVGISCSLFHNWVRKCHFRHEQNRLWAWQNLLGGVGAGGLFYALSLNTSNGGGWEAAVFFWNADVKYSFL